VGDPHNAGGYQLLQKTRDITIIEARATRKNRGANN
jgi:hypothetical protein